MQDRASELPRMLILDTWVNKPPGGVPASTELFALAYMDREVPSMVLSQRFAART